MALLTRREAGPCEIRERRISLDVRCGWLRRTEDRLAGCVRADVAAPRTLTTASGAGGGGPPAYWSSFASAISMAVARSAAEAPRGSLPFGQYSSLWTWSSG